MNAALNPESLRSLEMRILAVQRTVVGPSWNFRNVISPFSRLWLVLDGQAVVRHHQREFRLKPGQVHLVPPFTVHDCLCPRRLDHYYLHFAARLPTGNDLLSLLDFEYQIPAAPAALDQFERLEALYPDRKLPCLDPAREEYRRYPLVVEQTAYEGPVVDLFEATGILALLLAPFLRTAQNHEGIHARATRQFLAVQQYIHSHMHENIRLGDLARVVELNPTYFSDRFQKLVGVRPLEYLMRRRLERAQYLLLTSRAPVKQVAGEVGVPDAAYFARAFTRHCGRSPSAYRALHVA